MPELDARGWMLELGGWRMVGTLFRHYATVAPRHLSGGQAGNLPRPPEPLTMRSVWGITQKKSMRPGRSMVTHSGSELHICWHPCVYYRCHAQAYLSSLRIHSCHTHPIPRYGTYVYFINSIISYMHHVVLLPTVCRRWSYIVI